MGSFIYYVRNIFRKTNISPHLIRTCASVYQGVRNVIFFGKFCERNKKMIPTVFSETTNYNS